MFFCHFFHSLPFFCSSPFLSHICTNVIYTSNAPKLFCGCRQTKYPLKCLCTRKQPGLFVCNVYKRCSVWHLYKTRGVWICKQAVVGLEFSEASAAVQRFLCFSTLSANKDKHLAPRSFWETEPSDLRPASVAAPPDCMTRPQAGVITPVPSTVRSGISMTSIGQERR